MNAYIPRVCVNGFIIGMYQLRSYRDVMCIGWSDFYGMNQPYSGIHANVSLHYEVPLIAFLCLMHLRTALLLRILSRARRIDDCGIDDRAALHDVAGLHHDAVDCFKECFVQIVFLQNRLNLRSVVASGASSSKKSIPTNLRKA